MRERERASVTRHISRTRRIRPAADAQLPVAVAAPALDPASAHNCARVETSQGDGNGGEAWRGKEGSGRRKELKDSSLGPANCQHLLQVCYTDLHGTGEQQ